MKNIKYVVFFILMIIPFCFVMEEGSLSLRSKLKVSTLFNGSSGMEPGYRGYCCYGDYVGTCTTSDWSE